MLPLKWQLHSNDNWRYIWHRIWPVSSSPVLPLQWQLLRAVVIPVTCSLITKIIQLLVLSEKNVVNFWMLLNGYGEYFITLPLIYWEQIYEYKSLLLIYWMIPDLIWCKNIIVYSLQCRILSLISVSCMGWNVFHGFSSKKLCLW